MAVVALVLSAPAIAALPGVTEFRTSPERVADAELAALLDVQVRTADVVAIGETVHGSSALLRMQTRLVRYLVEKHGFRLIAWENPPLRSLEFSRWVASCMTAASPAPLDVLYMPTESDRPLWDWVCEFNRRHANDPIVFRGTDVWDRPWEHYARIRALGRGVGIDVRLLEQVQASCPAYRAASWADVDALFAQLSDRFVPEADYERCRAVLTSIMDGARRSGLDKRKNDAAGADDAFELAISASTLLGWLGFYHYAWRDDVLSWNERDAAQGRNLALVMEKHDARRAILSAHTSHVSHNRSKADWWGFGDIKSGVHFFAAATRRKVFNIALTAYEASGTQGQWSLPTARNSLDRTLRDSGHAFAFFTAGAAFLREHPRWWIQNQNAERFENGVELVPADHFDAFVFFERSHLDRALPARPMWEP